MAIPDVELAKRPKKTAPTQMRRRRSDVRRKALCSAVAIRVVCVRASHQWGSGATDVRDWVELGVGHGLAVYEKAVDAATQTEA
ncbi:MAG: hypothetical protein Rubg2KO_35450 [Rubricoccaceae bacterium]